MTDEAIADRLGWETARVNEVFSPAIRKYFALGNINNPLAALDRVKANLERMTDEAIADRLGWSEQHVRDAISPFLRVHVAVMYINDPVRGIEDYVAGKIMLNGRYY